VAVRRDVDNLIERTLERFGRVDILLANAGQFTQGRIADVDVEALVSMVDTNLAGVIRCIKGVLPSMIAQKSGDIIVTSSISGHLDIDGEAVYSASKHGVIGQRGLSAQVEHQDGACFFTVGGEGRFYRCVF